jgi:nucleotide-binding universal stress UspA family protein
VYATILWATDASPESDAALEAAIGLLDPDGTLFAFHCDQRFFGGRMSGSHVLPDEHERRRHIDDQVSALRAQGVDAHAVVDATHNDPAYEIAAHARELAVDAIVCGTRSLQGLGVVGGSVASRLLKRASVPVVVVPPGQAVAPARASRRRAPAETG